MTSFTQFGSLFPSSSLLRLIEVLKNGGTHYTIFGDSHRYAKIVSEPKGTPLWTPPIGGVGSLVGNEGKIQDMGI